MGLRERIRNAGLNLAGAAGQALMDLAKADNRNANPGGVIPTDDGVEEPRALMWDPFAIIEQLGYKERPSQITYGTLKAITYKMPIITAIIQLRMNQIAAFAHPTESRYDLGFRIRPRQKKKEPSRVEQRWGEKMERIIQNCGVSADKPRRHRSFERFLKEIAWDSMTYDQMTFEVVPNRKGLPADWYATDSSTMRQADTATTYMNRKLPEAVRYVQIYDGMIINEYTESELCFGVRNPRTDIRLYGYGVSELELMIQTVTALLWGWEYNQKVFSQGSVHKGLLNLKGKIPEKQMRSFRRFWYQMLSGVENSWRTPILNAEEAQWVDMHKSNRDMEYNAWMDFLIKVACAIYQMDPIELNFKYGNVGQKGALAESSNKEKITESKDRGLKPVLRFIAGCLNELIIWPINPEFELEFAGLDAQTHDDVAKLNGQLVKSTRTIDELRADDDLPPLPDGMGELILDPNWMQARNMAQQQAMAAEQAEMGGIEEGVAGAAAEAEPPDFEEILAGAEGGGEEAEVQKSLRRLNGSRHNRYVVDVEL